MAQEPTAAVAGLGERAAAWERKFQVYHERRFGPAAPVRGHEVRDFLRFVAQRWQAPEWQVEEARAKAKDKRNGARKKAR